MDECIIPTEQDGYNSETNPRIKLNKCQKRKKKREI